MSGAFSHVFNAAGSETDQTSDLLTFDRVEHSVVQGLAAGVVGG